MTWHPDCVVGHQLERLRLRLLARASKLPDRPFAYFDGRKLHSGRKSKHKTPFGRKLNAIARIKRRLAGRH